MVSSFSVAHRLTSASTPFSMVREFQARLLSRRTWMFCDQYLIIETVIIIYEIQNESDTG